MPVIIWLFLMTFILGPAGGAAFAFGQGLSPLETAIAISAIHVALVPVWFGIFKFIKYEFRYKERFVRNILGKRRSRKLKRSIEGNIRQFERRVGQLGFGVGVVGFTFLFGVSWAALGACLLNINERMIMVGIAIGAVASSIFWTIVFAGFVWFLPSPWVLYLIGTVLTFAIIGGEKLHEQKLIREMSKSLRKLGIKTK
ncbi:MAG: hypothetical protein QMD00_03625 [Hadesarchaea archaeon]|nr:hypothetical protein [Hadesarchaea archaeon]